ncbi:hypothetical protein EHV15_01350 [Paenibacillus oralis]|uniref:Uncharacterized protein n=1 Tax=Paenibacillus oralis TaxID=2490856 RepID=A0A3P3TVA7_9BACL|nr:hypothetical protein [Paenibacillus oralis]RRJ61770.1 hypothetical protein EHV15_01350 [Paenibacillus oralis]
MDNLNIIPGQSIGDIKLGMTKTQAENAIKSHADLFAKIEYDSNDKIHFIEIGYGEADRYRCLYRDIDLFNTKVTELVEILDQVSPYDRNDSELGYTYNFPEMGLSLWRPVILTEEDLQQDWFKELSPDLQEDEMKHLYFEAVAVYKPGEYY